MGASWPRLCRSRPIASPRDLLTLEGLSVWEGFGLAGLEIAVAAVMDAHNRLTRIKAGPPGHSKDRCHGGDPSGHAPPPGLVDIGRLQQKEYPDPRNG
jgi:hypothetical protein